MSEYSDAIALHRATHLVRSHDSGAEPGLSWFATGAPHEELNQILEVDVASLDRAFAILGEAPGLWHVWPGITDPAVEAALLERGLAFVEEEPLMVAEAGGQPATAAGSGLGTGLGTEVDGIEIVEVTTPDEIADWVRVWAKTVPVDGDSGAIARGLTQPGHGPGTALRLLAARDGSRTVATALLVIAPAGAAAIEHVATVAEARRRGIGARLTSAAMELAAAAGSHTIVLTASPMGEAIYRRLGFRTVGHVRRFG